MRKILETSYRHYNRELRYWSLDCFHAVISVSHEHKVLIFAKMTNDSFAIRSEKILLKTLSPNSKDSRPIFLSYEINSI